MCSSSRNGDSLPCPATQLPLGWRVTQRRTSDLAPVVDDNYPGLRVILIDAPQPIDARQIASRSQPASKDGFKPVGRCVSSHAAEFEVPWGRSPSRSSCNRYAGNHCSSTAAIGRPVELIGRAGNQRLRSLFIGAASGANFVEPVSRCPARRTASRATANPPGATSAR